MWDQYTWVFGIALIVAFGAAFGIGANDVANSFGTSVGAKAITIFQAVIIAAVCEFLGAVLLGANVTDTIKSNIAKQAPFVNNPELLMFGMFMVLCTACIWDNLCCHLELPVSTTHTTIGAIVGMTVVLRGFNAVVWSQHQDAFPYIKGMVPIFLSWVVSPFLAAICVIILYGLILRPFVLRSQHSFVRAFYVIPALVGVTFFVIVYFIIQTGNKNKTWDKAVPDGRAVWISIIPAVFFSVFTMFVIMPLIRRRVLSEHARIHGAATAVDEDKLDIEHAGTHVEGNAPVQPNALQKWWNQQQEKSKIAYFVANNPVTRTVVKGITYDCHSVVTEGHKDYDKQTAAVWQHAEVFDEKTEAMFRYLQVFSACVMSLAHGSNDVANAMGPFSAIYSIWSSASITSKSRVPEWILVIGGGGIVAGLALFGYKIMRVIGVKAAKLSNSRGFCCELSTAIVVMVASRYGLPVSTTQTIMGAVWMMGLFEGIKGVNKKVLVKTLCGWVLTLIVAALLCGGLSAFTMYAPQKTASDDIYSYSKALGADSLAMVRQLNSTFPSNAALLQDFNSTIKPAFGMSPHVAKTQIDTFNRILQLYNSTLSAA
ncbi:hypothetical protein ABBQ38_010750 [Trebouxia sp. C0009 RCD-2024]